MGLTSWLSGAAGSIESGLKTISKYTDPFYSLAQKPATPTGPQSPQQPTMVGGLPMNTPQQESAGLLPTLENTLQAINYIRNKAISQPISTALLVAGNLSEKPLAQQPGDLFNAHTWGTAWTAAAHISPGQTFFLNPDKNQFTQAENSPLEYQTPPAALLPQGFENLSKDQQQAYLKSAGAPVIGNQYVANLEADNALFKYGSGAADFAFSWYADPTVLAGKLASRVSDTLVEPGEGNLLSRVLKPQVTPLTRPALTPSTALANAVKAKLPLLQPKAVGWSGQDINTLLDSGQMNMVQRYLWNNHDDPQLLNSLNMAKTSALGPRFGAIISTLQSPGEVNDFLRVSMGDVGARVRLEQTNALAAQRIEQDTNRLSAMGLMRGNYAYQPNMMALINSRMTQLQAGINADVDMVDRYNAILGAGNKIDSVKSSMMELTRAASKVQSMNAYTAGAGNPSVNLGIAKTRIGAKFFSNPVTLIKSFSNFKPRGWLDLQSVDQDSINELRGFLARIPDVSPDVRGNIVNQYLTAPDEGTRLDVVQSASKLAMGKISAKHGLSPELGEAIYNEDRARLGAQQDNLRQYATTSIDQGGPRPIRADAFTDGGTALSIHPNLVTRLINSHILPDLDRYDTILARHSSALGALAVKGGDVADAVTAGADFFNQAWKFGTLFRLGYIPRVLGDDLAGQMARLGMASMAMRAGYGVKNLATNLSSMMLKPYYQAAEATGATGVAYADSELGYLAQDIAKEQAWHDAWTKGGSRAYRQAQGAVRGAQVAHASATAAMAPQKRLDALAQLIKDREAALAKIPKGLGTVPAARRRKLADLIDQQDQLQSQRDAAEAQRQAAADAQLKVRQGQQAVTVDGVPLPGAFEGTRGQFYQQVISPDESLANVFNTNKQLVHGTLMRSWDHGAVQVNAIANESLHANAWAHVLTAQMGQDAAARRVLSDVAVGKHVDESAVDLEKWLTGTPEGIAYRKRLGLKNTPTAEIANSIAYDVHETAQLPTIADQALSADGVSPGFLKKAIPNPADRPDTIAPGLGANYTMLRYHRVIDRAMTHWFDTVATKPAKFWSRHPLFNQLYEGHAKTIMASEKAQGITQWTAQDADRIAEQSRSLALKDTRKLVFDIAHQSDAMSALKLVTPFFAASAEGWQRWARIIADRPEVAGYAAKFFNVPLSLGWVQDDDGNPVNADGEAYDPVQKKMVAVPMEDRHVVVRVPFGLANGPKSPLGALLGGNSKGQISLSENSMNLVLNGDPWFNPGEGPIVTVPLQEYVKDKPTDAELAQKIGALPYGPSTSTSILGQVGDQIIPNAVTNFLRAYDTSDNQYQQIKLQITQDNYFQHAQFGAKLMTASQIASATRNYWLFRATSAFIGPVSSATPDPYAFYRQQYNNLLRTDSSTADQKFLDTYGQSYFVFAQSLSKNASGVPATIKAANLAKKYGNLIAQNPDLAPLIIGPDGNGPFSSEAYTYELNTPLVPGGSEMMRTKMSATDAMNENQKRLGWAQYTGVMNWLNAQAVNQNLKSYTASPQLTAIKKAYVAMLATPTLPDGKANPEYNEQWANDYYSFDSQKYEQLIPELTQVAYSDLSKDPDRSDLRVLQSYLQYRQFFTQALAARSAAGGSADITATKGADDNSDLLNTWNTVVGSLIESNVNFGNLYQRYLSSDLGTNVVGTLPQAEQEAIS